jgi:hypothetical protein
VNGSASKWPEALKKVGAWPLAGLKDSFFQGQLTRLEHAETALLALITRAVQQGALGMGVGPDEEEAKVKVKVKVKVKRSLPLPTRVLAKLAEENGEVRREKRGSSAEGIEIETFIKAKLKDPGRQATTE